MNMQANFTLPANNELILGVQYQQDKVKQTSVGQTSSNSTTGFPPAVNYEKNLCYIIVVSKLMCLFLPKMIGK